MTITEYFAVNGSGLSNRDAATIGPEIAKLEQAGRSTAPDIRDAARNPDSPLHKYVFDCADHEAADRYYVARAGHILRSVQVEVLVKRDNGELVPHRMRAWYPVHDAETDDDTASPHRRYVAVSRVLDDPELASQVWRDGLRRLQLFRQQFKDYDDVFGPVFRALAKIEKKLEAA